MRFCCPHYNGAKPNKKLIPNNRPRLHALQVSRRNENVDQKKKEEMKMDSFLPLKYFLGNAFSHSEVMKLFFSKSEITLN